MHFSWWLKLLTGYYAKKTNRADRKRKAGSRIFLEALEERVVPATLDWTGANPIPSSAPGLNGSYYTLNPSNFGNGNNGSFLIDNSNAAWLGNPANNYAPVTAVLTGPIDFPNVQANSFSPYASIGGQNVEARWVGDITIPGTGATPISVNFATTSDDGSALYVDGTLVVSNNNFQGPTQQTGMVTNLLPGSTHTIDIEYYQGGGGGAMAAQWDPAGGTNFVDIPNSAFTIPTSVGNWSNAGNWVIDGTSTNAVPANGDTVVFNSSVTGTGAYNSLNDIPGLTLNGIVVNNTSTTAYNITGNAVTITNNDPTLTSGISDQSLTAAPTTLGLTSITLGANTNIDNTSAFPTSNTPGFVITSNIDMAGHVLSSGPSQADAVSSTPDTGLTEISGVISSSVANTDAVMESSYGVLALAGNNTYDGMTNVFNGVLVAAGNNSLGSTTGGAKTVNPNANPLPGNPGAALGIANGGDNAAYTNGVTIQGAGPSVIGGALWNSDGNTNVFNAPITLAGATTFEVNNGGSLSLGGALNLGSNVLTLAGNHNLTLSGIITGSVSSSITDTDSATTTLTNNNAPFLGSININAGILAADANSALGVGTGAVTVASGAALGFGGSVNYSTAQPVSITGSGPGGNGAVESLSGTNSFAGTVTVTVASGDEYLGAIGGSTTLTAPVNLTTNNLFLVGSGGNLALSGMITGPSTSTITKNGTGTDTISNNNSASFAGSTIINQGVLAVSADGALGNGSGAVTVNSGGGLGFSGGVTYATVQPVSIIGSGTTGNGAIENLNGVNSFAGPISLALNATIGSDAGTLTLSGNVHLAGFTLTGTGSGNTVISGVIDGNATTVSLSGLLGNYYVLSAFNSGSQNQTQLIDSTNANWLGNPANNYVPVASSLLAGPIDFQNVGNNGFQDPSGTTYYNEGGGNNNVDARWIGLINIPGTGSTPVPISFGTSSDDGSVIYIDSTLVINNNAYQGSPGYPNLQVKNTVNLTPGLHAIDVEYFNGNGGASVWAQWDPTGGSTFVDIPVSVLSFSTAGTNALIKNGTGTLTLSNNNTYIGPTTINAGTVVAANNNAFGSVTGGGITVNNGSDLALPAAGGITLSAAKTLTLAGAGPAGNGAIENLGGNNSVAGNITLAANASVGSDATLTSVTVPNFSFETPNLGIGGNAAINPGPTGAGVSWTFNAGSGIAQNNANYGPPNAPDGTQAALIQNAGANFFQSITFPSAGEYVLTFAAAGRNNAGPNPFQVSVDGTQVGTTITPTNNVYATFTITFNIASSGAHTLTFTGLGNNGNDVSSFIDNVTLGELPTAPPTLTLSGNVALNGSNLTATGSGNTTVSGVIAGSGSFTAAGILGNYFATAQIPNGNTGNYLLSPASGPGQYLGTLTPTAVAVTPNIDFTDIANNGFVETGFSPGFPQIRGNNVAAQWVGNITFPAGTTAVNFQAQTDDNSAIYLNGVSLPLNGQQFAGFGASTGSIPVTAGTPISFEVDFEQGGGGANAEINWDLTGGTNFVSIPASAFSIVQNLNSVTKTGFGTLTLSNTNTYIGATTINAGTVVATVDGALGTAAGGTTVNAGGALAFSGGVTYATVEPVTIAGNGATGNGAIENISGTNSFAGPITLSAAATIGSDAGTLTLGGSTVSMGLNDLTTTGAGSLVLADTLSGTGTTSTQNNLIKNGLGTTTLSSSSNSYTGLTSVNQGTLIAAADNALGAVGGGTTVASGATLGIQGGITYTALEPVTLNGSGVGGVGAFANVSGNNSFAGPISLATDSTIGSATGILTLSGNIGNTNAVVASNLTFTGGGNVDVAGAIQNAAPVAGLLGQYFNINAAANLIAPAASSNLSWLGNQTPAVTAILTGPIDFPNVSNNGFADNVGTPAYYNIPGNNNNVEGRWFGSILIPGTGTTPVPINFATTSDDGSVLDVDGVQIVNNNFSQSPTQRTGLVSLTPGLHFIDIEYYQGGGGAAMDAQWDSTGGSTFVDIPNSVFSYQPPGIGNVVKNGSGTVTLGATNTYTGTTTVNGGTLQVTSDANLGSTATSAVTINAGTLEALGTFTSTHNYVVGNAASTILVDPTQTLTIPTIVTGTGNLNKTGLGTLTLTATNSTYSGGTTVTTGTLAVSSGSTPLGTGTVTMNGGILSLLGGTQELPIAVTGFNQDVIWTGAEANSQTGTTAAFDSGGGHVFYAAGVPFTPGGGLPASQTIVSQSNPATTFALQPYTASNVLLSTDTNNYTLALSNPGQYQTLSILDAAANGASTFNISLNFATGTPTVLTGQTARDWFSGGTSAISGLGAITRSTSGLNFTGLPSNPSLYELDLPLSASDQARVLNSITFTQTGTPADLGIFALSGEQVSAQQLYGNNVVVSASSTINVQNGAATLGTLSIGSSTLTTTGGAGNGLTLGTTTLTGNPAYAPAANTTLTLGALNDGGTPRTITINGAGSVTRNSAAISAVDGTAVNLVTGTLNLNAPGALGTFANTTVSVGGTLNLGANETLGALNGAGTVNLNGNTLTVGNTNNLASSFTGTLADGSGAGGLVKAGAGTFTFATGATPTYSGTTSITAGTLLLDVSLLNSSSVSVGTGATLGGTGSTAHAVTVASGGTVSPGDVLGATASITTGGISLATGSIYNVELGGSAAGLFDQLVVAPGGTVSLNGGTGAGAILNLSLVNGFVPALNQSFTIINDLGTNPVGGTFNGLTAGSTITLNNRYVFTVSYTGGANNNSVVLTATQVPGPATTFSVVASPTTTTAGGSVNFTVTALDANNLVATGFNGPVTLTSSDGQAVFPVNNYTFTTGPSGDNGVHIFTATLGTAGNQTVTATDAAITGTSNPVLVTAGSFSKYVVALPAGNTVVAGNSFVFTVQAADSFGNAVSSYSGPTSVAITAAPTDLQGSIPASVSLNSSGFGFALGTLKTVGSYSITAMSGTFSGTSSSILVTPAVATHFVVTGPSSTLTLNNTSFTVTAEDQYNNVATGYSGTVHFTSSDAAIAAGSGLPANSTLASGSGTFTATLKTPGNQTITATDTTNGITGNSAAITTHGLYVTSFATTPTGFTATFSKVVNITQFDYYRFAASQAVPPDVAMATTNSATTNVNGSLLVNATATQTTITFVATQGVLTNAAKYFVTLTSGANGIVDTSGEQLAGDLSGFSPGTNYVASNLVPAVASTPTLSIPGFARGPDSNTNVLVPNSGTGIPITLKNAPASTTDVKFTLTYNPALLTITGTVNPATGTLTLLASSTPGTANFEYNGAALSTSSTPTVGDVGNIVANVPNSAANQMLQKALLDLPVADIFFNGSVTPASPVQNADGVQVLDYLGETTTSYGVINSNDAANAQAVVTANATPTTANQPAGFKAFPLADPFLIAGSTNSGTFKVVAGDVTGLSRFAVNLSHPFIPTPPTGLTYSSPGPDPTLSIPTNLVVMLGGTVTVPVNIDDPRPAGSSGMTEADLALTYDPSVFSVTTADVQLGTVPAAGSGWTVQADIDPLTGEIAITLDSLTPISSDLGGSLVTIDFHVKAGASTGTTPINLVADVNPRGQGAVWTRVFDTQQEYTLSPAPTNGPGGVVGVVTIKTPPGSVASRRVPVLGSGSLPAALTGMPSAALESGTGNSGSFLGLPAVAASINSVTKVAQAANRMLGSGVVASDLVGNVTQIVTPHVGPLVVGGTVVKLSTAVSRAGKDDQEDLAE